MSFIIRWHIAELNNDINARQRRVSESRTRRRARALLKSTLDPFRDLAETEFINTFRLGKDSVKNLAEDHAPHIPRERRNDGVTVMLKVKKNIYIFGLFRLLNTEFMIPTIHKQP